MKLIMKITALTSLTILIGTHMAGAEVVLQGPEVSSSASMYSAKEARSKNYSGRFILSRANVFYQTLLKFDLKQLGNKKVKDAAIFLYANRQYHKRPMLIEVFQVTSDWRESEANYNDCRKGVKWKSKGGDRNELPLARFEVKAEFINGWVLVKNEKLTELVNKWLDRSAPNYGLLFRPAFKFRGQSMKFFVSGPKAQKDKLPKLVLSYDKDIAPADFGVIDADTAQKMILQKHLDKVSAGISRKTPQLETKIKLITRKIQNLEAGNKFMITEIQTEIKNLRFEALKELYPGETIKTWSIGPWEPMCPVQFPSLKSAVINGVMLQNEYLELSAGISNLSAQKQTVKLTVNPEKSGIPLAALQLRTSYWVKALLLKEDQKADRENFQWVDDVLPLLNKGSYTSLNPGENRRIWLTVNSAAVKPGIYSFALEIKSARGESCQVPVKLTVLPVKLWRDPGLAVYTYAYLNRGSTSRFKNFAVADLLKHYQNTFVLGILPEYDAAKGTADFSAIVDYVRYLPKDAKRIMFFWNCESGKVPFCPAKGWGSARWKATLKKVVLQWYAELKKAGFSEEQIVMYPFDETYGNPCCGMTEYKALADVAGELHAVNPQIQIFMDPVAFGKKDIKIMRSMAESINIWAPVQDLYKPGNYKGWPQAYSYREKLAVRKLFEEEKEKGKLLWTYQCSGPSRIMDVNNYYRRIAWSAWLHNVTGLGLWSYNDIRGGSGWSDEDRGDFSLIYELRDAPADIPPEPYEPLIPSRRWQMWRIAVQDYFLLQQAAQKVGREKIEKLAKKVLQNSQSPDSYEQTRMELHKILLKH